MRRMTRRAGIAALLFTAVALAFALPPAAAAEEEEEAETRIARVKRFRVTPMGPEEAVEQMELLGHSFFVFFNPDEGEINVVYARRDGTYGLIQPEMD